MKAVEPDWERVDVHCLAMTLWLLATGENNPPRGPLLAGGEYCLAHRLDHDYLPQLDGVLAAATNESPKARSSLDAFEQGLRDWQEGFAIRAGIAQEVDRRRAARRAVLRWLVSFVRTNPTFELRYDVEPSKPSEIPGLTEEDVSEALEELVEHYMIVAQPHLVLGKARPIRWTGIYPTAYGVEEVEDPAILAAQAAPLVRALLEPVHQLSLSAAQPEVELHALRMPPQELYFLLSYLETQGLVSFKSHREGGTHRLYTDVKATSRGREWLAERYG